MAKSRVIGIKADSETAEKFEKIPKDSNKEWLEENVNKEINKKLIALPDLENPEKFITIPASEYAFLSLNTGALKHANFIFERIVKRSEFEGKKPDFDVLFGQLEAFWKMNGLFLDKRKDGAEWIVNCEHRIGKPFSRFFFHLMRKICNWTGKYDLYDKKILEDSLIVFIKKIPPGTRRKRLTQK
jgi:hypothetical protein